MFPATEINMQSCSLRVFILLLKMTQRAKRTLFLIFKPTNFIVSDTKQNIFAIITV